MIDIHDLLYKLIKEQYFPFAIIALKMSFGMAWVST